jgi:2-polyprenyl-6-hydroxyphenyl methylase/3-demethylubiquinone-9 3-methyltransferase
MARPDRLDALDPGRVTIDNDYYHEVGESWWDPIGPLRALHDMNPARVSYFDTTAQEAFGPDRSAVRVLDIGCGGGLVSERMAALGYRVTGLDLSTGSIETARRHAAAQGVEVEYRVGSAFDLPLADGSVDLVVVSDVLEHLHDLSAAIAQMSRVLRPGGLVVFDTVNRTAASWFKAILLSERVLRIVYPGTHNWSMFIRPDELRAAFAAHGLALTELRGLEPVAKPYQIVGNVIRGRAVGPFHLTDSTAVSYIGRATKYQEG